MLPILSSLALYALLAGAPCELPCRCVSVPSLVQARDSAKAVFVGRVISQRDSVWLFRDTINDRELRFHQTEHTLVIDAAWKLPAGVSDTIRVWRGKTSCDWPLALDGTYLIFAEENRFHPGLVSFGCGRTNDAGRASDDIAALGTPLRGALAPGGYPQPASRTAARLMTAHLSAADFP